MNLLSKVKTTNSKSDFIEALTLLKKDFIENQETWENKTIDQYLDAIVSWAGDYHDTDIDFDKPDWKTVSALFYMGKIYE